MCFFSSSTSVASSSITAVFKRSCFNISRLPIGPPISEPATNPNVAAAVQSVDAPEIPKSSSTGPNAPAVPCPPTIGIEPVLSPISGLTPTNFANPTETRFWLIISTITQTKNTTRLNPPLFNTFKLA